jgi:membrane protease subunit HflC
VKARTERYVRRYLQTVGGVQAAESRLEERIQAALAAEIGRTRLAELATLDREALKLEPMLERVTASIRAAAIEQFGIEVVDVRLKRFNYPQAVKPAVFAEIRSERERVAVQYRAEGESEKMRIESQATLQRDRLLAQAQREASQMRGEGEAKAIEIFNAAHGKNPAFYQLLKTLETYRAILDEQTTVVLSADSPLLKLLSQGLPEPAEMPGAASPSPSAGATKRAAPVVAPTLRGGDPVAEGGRAPSPSGSAGPVKAGPAAAVQGATP